MSFRLYLINPIRKIANFVDSLIIAVLKEEDLFLMTKNAYLEYEYFVSWTRKDFVFSGLSNWERQIVKKANLEKNSKVLNLFCGAGRDAIGLAKLGFEIIGVDYSNRMIKKAKNYSKNYRIKYLIQDVNSLAFKKKSFDAVVIFNYMYGSIPVAQNRIKFLNLTYDILKPQGKFIFNFTYKKFTLEERFCFYIRKVLAYLVRGNLKHQMGDVFHLRREFAHYFQSKKEILKEIGQTQFKIDLIDIDRRYNKGFVILKK